MGNGQVERYNGVIWKTISLCLRSKGLKINQWELALPDALHSLRSLLCTATNCTPHDRADVHLRKAFNERKVHANMVKYTGLVLIKKHVRQSKYDALVEKVELLESNPDYALVRHPDGREQTVSVRHLAPCGERDAYVQSKHAHNPGRGSKENLDECLERHAGEEHPDEHRVECQTGQLAEEHPPECLENRDE